MKELHSNIKGLQVLKYGLVSRKEKDSRSVVFCFSKGNEAAEVALRGRLATLRLAQLVEHFTINEKVAGSIPVTYILNRYRKRKVRFGTILKVLNTTLAIECGAMEVASQSCLFG